MREAGHTPLSACRSASRVSLSRGPSNLDVTARHVDVGNLAMEDIDAEGERLRGFADNLKVYGQSGVGSAVHFERTGGRAGVVGERDHSGNGQGATGIKKPRLGVADVGCTW